jgi:hypothetical protein
MVAQPQVFKRLLLRLELGLPDHTMQLAVELAELLHIELLGLFLETRACVIWRQSVCM